MSNPYIKSLIYSVGIIGLGWTLYCISPAGAAEREYSRQQNVQRQMYRKQQQDTAEKSA